MLKRLQSGIGHHRHFYYGDKAKLAAAVPRAASRLPSAFSWANALRASSQVVKCPARTIKMGTRDPSAT